MKRLRLKCEAAPCGEPAAPDDNLCPAPQASRRAGLMARCLNCDSWMDQPVHWGYTGEDCAYQQSEKVNRRLTDQHGVTLFHGQNGKCAPCKQPIALGRGRLPDAAGVDLDHIKPRPASWAAATTWKTAQLLHRTGHRRKGAMTMAGYQAWADAPPLPL